MAPNIALRVSGIPATLTGSEFIQDLGNWLSSEYPEEMVGIIGWSFAPSATSVERDTDRVATITLEKTPEALRNGGVFTVKLKGQAYRLRFDSHFHGMTPLNSPPGKLEVDIIAVTGLSGHAFGSWKSRGDDTMWLRDFLPDYVPTARILTYGYDSTLFKSESNSSIMDFAGRLLEMLVASRAKDDERLRPIIFIGHSLGGLVIKHTLVRAARGSPQHKLVFLSCYGLIFFGVPNRGLHIDTLRSMVKGQPNARLVEDLHPESRALDLLHDDFCHYFSFEDAQIVSVYETKYTKTVIMTEDGVWKRAGPSVLMVNQHSATYAGPTEKRYDQLSIDSDHSDMTKFSHRQDFNFVPIRQKIIDFVRDAPEVIDKRFDAGKRM